MKAMLTKYWNQLTTWFKSLSTGGKIMFGLIVFFLLTGGWVFSLILAGCWWLSKNVGVGGRKKKLEQDVVEAKAFFEPIIASKTLPVIAVDVNLQKDEKCYYLEENVPLSEERSVRVTHGGGGSFRVMKGVWAHSYSSQSVSTPQLRKVDIGTIFVTNKRLIYLGSLHNKNIKYDDILATHQYNDAISVSLGSNGKNEFFGVNNPILFKGMMALAPHGDGLKKVKNINMQYQIT